MIVNKTGVAVEIKQRGFDENITGIEADTRQPLCWNSDSMERFLNIRVIDEAKDWSWSGNLSVLELGTVNFMCRNANNKKELMFMRTDVRSDASNIYVVIERVADSERPFLV